MTEAADLGVRKCWRQLRTAKMHLSADIIIPEKIVKSYQGADFVSREFPGSLWTAIWSPVIPFVFAPCQQDNSSCRFTSSSFLTGCFSIGAMCPTGGLWAYDNSNVSQMVQSPRAYADWFCISVQRHWSFLLPVSRQVLHLHNLCNAIQI